MSPPDENEKADRQPSDRSVLFVHPSDEAYGADRVLLRLAAGFKARGWRVRVLLSDDEPAGWLTEALDIEGVEVHRGPLAPARRRYLTLRGIAGYLRGLLRARAWVRDEVRGFGPAIVHINTSALLVGAILGRPGRAALVWHVHEIVVRPRLGSWLFRLAPLTATRVVAVSNAVRTHVSPGGVGRHKVTVVWNGADDRSLVPIGDVDPPTVAFIGRLNRWKGWDVFIEAVAQTAPEFPSVRFIVAGDPPPGEEWRGGALRQQVARLGMAERVEVRGFVGDVPALIDRVSVVVTPAIWPEPFGIVTLEAMMAGRAVIATAHGGSLDLIEPGTSGILVPPNDVSALAAAMTAVLRDSHLRDSLGSEARVRAQRHFSAVAAIDGIERVYRKVLAGPTAAVDS